MLCFDLDGTLVDAADAQARAWEAAFRNELGLHVSLASVPHHGATALTLVGRLAGTRRLSADATGRLLRSHAAALAAEPELIRPLPGAVETLTELLEAGITCCVVTGNTRRAADVLVQHGLVDGRGPLDLGRGAYGDEATQRRDVIALALSRNPQAIAPLVIGDTPADIAAARDNRCSVAAVATGAYDLESLGTHHPDLLLDSLEPPAAAKLRAFHSSLIP
jgi:phosphoglycolate phosphatase